MIDLASLKRCYLQSSPGFNSDLYSVCCKQSPPG